MENIAILRDIQGNDEIYIHNKFVVIMYISFKNERLLYENFDIKFKSVLSTHLHKKGIIWCTFL